MDALNKSANRKTLLEWELDLHFGYTLVCPALDWVLEYKKTGTSSYKNVI